jgi:RNA polymerase sigma-70 factor (ECF subfamily)
MSVARGGVVDAAGGTSRAAAFEALAEQHLESSYRLARAILGNMAEAEDATHDALVQAWRHWGQLRDPASFEHWFDRIVVNTCRNRLRRGPKWAMTALRPDAWPTRPDPMSPVDDRDELATALARLKPDHRIVVALRFYRDMPLEEIAARTGVPVGTVNSRLHYALKQLRRGIER